MVSFSSSSPVVSVSLSSFAPSFGAAVRFLSEVALDGALSVSVCSYGSGQAFVDFALPPVVAAVWPAIVSLAFEEDDECNSKFVADWKVNGDNSRAAALEALLVAIRA